MLDNKELELIKAIASFTDDEKYIIIEKNEIISVLGEMNMLLFKKLEMHRLIAVKYQDDEEICLSLKNSARIEIVEDNKRKAEEEKRKNEEEKNKIELELRKKNELELRKKREEETRKKAEELKRNLENQSRIISNIGNVSKKQETNKNANKDVAMSTESSMGVLNTAQNEVFDSLEQEFNLHEYSLKNIEMLNNKIVSSLNENAKKTKKLAFFGGLLSGGLISIIVSVIFMLIR